MASDDTVSAFRIALTGWGHTLVDECDLAVAQTHKWFHRRGRNSYAYRASYGKGIYLHRLLMKAGPGEWVDHVNGDGLDNRRCNLRLATPTQNAINRPLRPSANKHGYRGVVSRPGYGFFAAIRHNGKLVRSRSGHTAKQAAREYDRMAREFHGEFAVLNFPEDTAR